MYRNGRAAAVTTNRNNTCTRESPRQAYLHCPESIPYGLYLALVRIPAKADS
jgi:hypothetical protein